MKSVMTPQERFARVSTPQIQRSTFDRSHGYKTTFDAGKLIPILVDEALPGDTFNLDCTVFGRLNTPLKPIMDNIMLDVHFFSCPIRLVWDNWEKMNGQQDDPGDSTDFIMPIIAAPASVGYLEDTIFDYFGIPTNVADLEHRADPLRCMNLIYNEWYRDENLQNSVTVNKDNGPDASTDYDILPRGKRKDYFTSALPWAQKADPVTIPLGTSAPVVSTGLTIKITDTADTAGPRSVLSGVGGSGSLSMSGSPFGVSTSIAFDDTFDSLEADLSTATAATVNAWREAFQLQALYELDARGGTRYIENIKNHFGVTSPDARLQRPEYLGGYTTNININPISQQSESGTTPQGNLAAMGTFSHSKKGFIKSFTEHEIILGFVSARADLNYQQGLNRMWSRSTRFDFYWPSLANLGEQAILNKELYADGSAADDDVFAYQERFAEYKYKPSMVTAAYRSAHSASLDIWHLAQDFASLPTLNSTFIEENPPIDRVIATPAEPQFTMDCYFKLICARPMPTYALPASFTKL